MITSSNISGQITKMQKKYKPKFDLNWCVHKCLSDGRWWTFWEIQDEIKQRTGKFYGEATISAAIRNMRKIDCRERFGFPTDMSVEVIFKKRRTEGKGYKYRLATEVRNYD